MAGHQTLHVIALVVMSIAFLARTAVRAQDNLKILGVIALVFVGVGAIGPIAQAEEKSLKLTGTQIQARFPGMEMTDEVHWGDVYRRNGALITTEMGHKTVGKWRVQKDQLCLDRGKELGNGCYEVWLSGKNVQLKNGESSLPLEGVLKKPTDRE